MNKISDFNYYQNNISFNNVKPKDKVLNTWCVGINDFAHIAGEQHNKRNILSPKAFLEFLAWVFTLGHVDFSERRNEAGRNMMSHVESTSYFKDDDGSEVMLFYMKNPEGGRADLPQVTIEITLTPFSTGGIRQGHTAIIFPQTDGLATRYEGKDFERKNESSLLLITNKVLACYQREVNKEIVLKLNNLQMNRKSPIDYRDFSKDTLANTLSIIKKEHLLLMPHVCDEMLPYLLGEDGILKEINNIKPLDDAKKSNNKEVNDEINDIKINLSHILIDSLDDADVDLSKVIDQMLLNFLDSPYINDVKILKWCLNKSMQYFDDDSKMKYACTMINMFESSHDHSEIVEDLFLILDKEFYKKSPEIHKLIWDKFVIHIKDFNLSNHDKLHLIQRLFDDVQSVFNKVPISILVNDIFVEDFFIKNPEMIKWYVPQLLKRYEGEKMYLDDLGYNFDDESRKEINQNKTSDVINAFEEKRINEFKLRYRLMQIIKNSKVDLYPYIDEQYLNKLNPPENLRLAMERFGWRRRPATA